MRALLALLLMVLATAAWLAREEDAPRARAPAGSAKTSPVPVPAAAGSRQIEPSTSIAAIGSAALASQDPATTATAQPSTAAALPAAPSTTADVPVTAAATLRRVVPGSKAHAALVVEALESREYADTAAPVARLYLAMLERTPDAEGFDWYVDLLDRGTRLTEIADEFAGSPELQQRYGALDDTAFVDRVYANAGVAADPAERAAWIARLASGELTRGGLLVAFSESGAFRAATSNEVYVTMAFSEALSRMPTAADHARWVAFLDAGNPRSALVQALIASRGK